MLLVCDCNLWLEKDRDFVVMGQMTLFGRITQAGIIEISFSSRKVLSFGQRSPRNRDEGYTSSPSSSVTLQRFGHLAAPVEPITGAKDLSVIRKPTSRWKTKFPNGNTVWEPEPINFRRGSLWNDETVVVPVSSNSLLWVFFLLVFPFTVFRNSLFVYTFLFRFADESGHTNPTDPSEQAVRAKGWMWLRGSWTLCPLSPRLNLCDETRRSGWRAIKKGLKSKTRFRVFNHNGMDAPSTRDPGK